MNRILQYSIVAVAFLTASCEKDFDRINTLQTQPTAIDPVFQLNTAALNSAFPAFSAVVYEMGIVQQIITPNSGIITGANFNQDNRGNTQANWQNYYRNVIRNTKDVIGRTREDAARSNLYNMARILQAYAFMVLTDTYGDVPYTEGGVGYSEQNFFPAYNAQQDIYADLIKELTEASAALNATGRVESGDVLYAGNVAQWKKFGYSLLLRAGMRLSEVDPQRAQQVAAAAFQGGVITANADNAVMRHSSDYLQPIGNTLNSTEAANFYLAAPFVNHLKTTNDPRLPAIAVRYVGAKSGPEQTPANASSQAALQQGMPMGYDNGTIGPVATSLGLASFYEFSQVDRRRMAKPAAPTFLVSAAQNLLLLAEARQRGWISAGTAEQYYADGIRAHMEQLPTYDPASAVAAADIQSYVAANPLNAANALEQINTQYWIASFLNGPEVWANFRRSGFPRLTPNPFAGKDIKGDFINRLTYPNSEISVNKANYDAAVARMGPDNLDTKVWWDK